MTAAPPPAVDPAAPPALARDPWQRLRRHTPARIGLGRAGGALPTHAVLRFDAAHALARDAVHEPLDPDLLLSDVAAALDPAHRPPGRPLVVTSGAADRAAYLQRPDLGRRLGDPTAVAAVGRAHPEGFDLSLVLADGLSARAVARHAPGLVAELVQRLPGWSLAPLVIARQARVALGDEVGALLGARLVIVLIGERPGLSAPDSLGAYLTWQPRAGRTDAERNCVSNIRPPVGLDLAEAARTISRLALGARDLGLTGVGLKDSGEALTS